MAVPDAYRGREQTYIKHTLLTKYLTVWVTKSVRNGTLSITSIALLDPGGRRSPTIETLRLALHCTCLRSVRRTFLKSARNFACGSALLNLIPSHSTSFVDSLRGRQPTTSRFSS